MPNDSTPVAPVTLWRSTYAPEGSDPPAVGWLIRDTPPEKCIWRDSLEKYLALPAPALTALIEALKFYAGPTSWCASYGAVTMLHSPCETDYDKGAKARTALAALEAS